MAVEYRERRGQHSVEEIAKSCEIDATRVHDGETGLPFSDMARHIVGHDLVLQTPYGERRIIDADRTATIIERHVGAADVDVLLATGMGCTGAINKLQRLMGP